MMHVKTLQELGLELSDTIRENNLFHLQRLFEINMGKSWDIHKGKIVALEKYIFA